MNSIYPNTKNPIMGPEMMMPKDQPYLRKIRSFVRREGRLTDAQERAFVETIHLIKAETLAQKPIDWAAVFGWQARKQVLEMGFGDGASLLEMAKAEPDTQFIGVEVYRAGVGNVINKLKHENLRNLKIIMADVEEIIDSCFEDQSIDTIQVFFPDPWHKKRHHKRRLLDTDFISVLVRKLKTEGMIHVATDWPDYADQILDVLSGHPDLKNLAPPPEKFVPRPDSRPRTKYEKRGLKLGHPIADMQFSKGS